MHKLLDYSGTYRPCSYNTSTALLTLPPLHRFSQNIVPAEGSASSTIYRVFYVQDSYPHGVESRKDGYKAGAKATRTIAPTARSV